MTRLKTYLRVTHRQGTGYGVQVCERLCGLLVHDIRLPIYGISSLVAFIHCFCYSSINTQNEEINREIAQRKIVSTGNKN